MIDSLAAAIALASLGYALLTAARAAAGRYRWSPQPLALVEFALAAQAILAIIGLAGGHRPRELAAHLAYVVTSVLLLPVAARQIRSDDGRWAGALLAGALVALAVVVVRMETTWRT